MTSEMPTPQADVATPRKRSRRRVATAVAATVVVLLGGGYVGAYAAAGDEFASDTAVAGVPIGNQSREEALATLEDELAGRLDEPITLTVGKRTVEVQPTAVGLEFDPEATLEQAAPGRSWDPRKLWRHYTGGSDLTPVVTTDEAKVTALAERLTDRAGTEPRNGTVTFAGGKVETTAPVEGRGVRADTLDAVLTETYLAPEGERRATVELTSVPPAIDQADVDRAVKQFAEPAMSGPVRLTFEKTPVELTPQEFSAALALTPKGGALEPTLRPKKLRQLLAEGMSADAKKPVDATVVLRNGTPTVVPGKPGVAFDQKEVDTAFLDLVAKPAGQREATIDATVVQPEFTTKEAEALGIKEKVSEFTTYYPYAEYRNVNIGRAAEIINGTVVKPGETFSLNETVGERTEENGFTAGWIIADGIFRSELGGGVSQMATTLYNAAFFAGLEDVEHKPHSLYISRYPEGREATVAWPTVDMAFRNDTDHGVLIEAKVTPATGSSQGVVTVRMYSTKTWDITTKTSERYAFTSGRTRTVTDGNCEDTSGAPGFNVDVYRYFHKPGSSAVVKTEKQTVTYIPQDEVICWEGGVNPNPQPQQPPAGGSGQDGRANRSGAGAQRAE